MHKRMGWPASIGAAVLLGTTAICAKAQDAPRTSSAWAEALSSLERDIPAWLTESGIRGMTVAAFSGDEEWAQAFGELEAESGRELQTTTLFEAASLSKPVFAHIIRGLIRGGSIDIDQPLASYYDDPRLPDDPRSNELTARLVLSHQTGFPNWARQEPLGFRSDPGERFGYSGEGYVHLQRVVEEVTGRTLDELAHEHVFGPYSMTHSSYLFDSLSAPEFAVPHHTRGTTFAKRPAPPEGNAAASLHSTAEDYLRFVRQTLELFEEDPEWGRDVMSPDVTVANGVSWSLGWALEDRPQGTALWHYGDNGPFKAFVYVVPDLSQGFVFFANSTQGLSLTSRIVGRLFPGEHPLFDWLDYDQMQ